MTTDMQRVVEAIRAFEKGEIIVVTDDDDRENEGDLILAAAHATPEKVAFIIRHTSGIVCAPVTPPTPAVSASSPWSPTTTPRSAPPSPSPSISATASPPAFPPRSVAIPCGRSPIPTPAPPTSSAPATSFRSSPARAASSSAPAIPRRRSIFAALPACRQVGVLAELVNDSGTVMRGPDVAAFAAAHKLKVVSVADLIAYRQRSERLVERVSEFPVTTQAGPARAVAYRTPFDQTEHLAIVFGDIRDGRGIPVRLHLESVVDDVFGAKSGLDAVVSRISAGGRGVIVYLREGAVGVVRGSGLAPAKRPSAPARSIPRPPRATPSGARSASAPRSSRSSASPRSASSPIRAGASSASTASASPSRAPRSSI